MVQTLKVSFHSSLHMFISKIQTYFILLCSSMEPELAAKVKFRGCNHFKTQVICLSFTAPPSAQDDSQTLFLFVSADTRSDECK